MIHGRREIPEHPVIAAMERWGEWSVKARWGSRLPLSQKSKIFDSSPDKGGAVRALPGADEASIASGSGQNFVSDQRAGNFGYRNRSQGRMEAGSTATAGRMEVWKAESSLLFTGRIMMR